MGRYKGEKHGPCHQGTHDLMLLLTGPLKGRGMLRPSSLGLRPFKQQVMWFFTGSSGLVKWSPVSVALFPGLQEQCQPALQGWPFLLPPGAWFTSSCHPAGFPKADRYRWPCETLRGQPMPRNRVLGESHSIVGGIGTGWLFLATQQPLWALSCCVMSALAMTGSSLFSVFAN